MRSAVIVDVVRTAVGRRNGQLSGWHPADLAGECLAALQQRNDLDPGLVDDVILGCVMQSGAQSVNVARSAVLAAGWPEDVPATTIDRQCGSSQQAVHFAAQGVMAGAYDVVVAGGIEVMSLVPMGASMGTGFGAPFGPRVAARYSERGGLVPQGVAAERLIESFKLSREELDAYGAASQARAARAAAEGRFGREIVPVAAARRAGDTAAGPTGNGLATADECISPIAAEQLAALKPSFVPGGLVTAGNSAQIGDGASAALIMAEQVAERLGYTARARFCGFALAGVDPLVMLSGPIPATRKVLDRCSLTIDDIDLAEVNEAFAAVVLAWAGDLQADMDRVNVNGGAIALGHPLGASGTRLLATLVNELERRGGRFGLQTMCEAGGMANALVIERLG